jgi:hypothetical protein
MAMQELCRRRAVDASGGLAVDYADTEGKLRRAVPSSE